MERILIVRLSALGDIVHAVPVLAAIKNQWPDAKVDWLVEEAYAPVLSLVQGLHRRVVIRARAAGETADSVSFGGAMGYLRAVRYLRRQRYEAALDLQGLIKSAVWARASGARRVIGFDRSNLREPMASVFHTEHVHPQQARHIIQKNLSVLYDLGVVPGPARVSLASEPRAAVSDVIARLGGRRGYIVINPGAAWSNKRWPAGRFGELAAALFAKTGKRTLVTWGPSERPLADEVCRASGGAASPAPPTEIADLACLMRDAALVVSGDTGPLHIAAAMGAPIVGLYGPTWPERNGPWAIDDEVISRAGICRCHHKRRCRTGAPCIEQIGLEDVVAAAERRMARAGTA